MPPLAVIAIRFAEVPAARAQEVVEKVNGSDVRGVKLRLEVAGRK